MKRTLKLSLISIGGVLLAAAVWLYLRYAAPTRIAFVNFTDFQYALFHDAAAWPFIRAERVTLDSDRVPNLRRFDAVYLFGMGLHLSRAQEEAFREAARRGTPTMLFGATVPDDPFTNLRPTRRATVERYLGYGGVANARRLLGYTRRVLDGKRLFTGELAPPYRIPAEAYFHLGDEDFFESFDDYRRFYEQTGRFAPDAPRVVLLCSNIGPQSPTTSAPVRSLIGALEGQGLNVYPVAGFFTRLQRIREVQPDIAVFVAHGRLAPGKPDEAIALLEQMNVPLLCPVILFEPYEEWMQSQRGMAGGMFGQNVVVPEVDGGTAPLLIGAQFPDRNGLMVFRELPERIERFARLVINTLRLRSTAPGDRRVAIVYYKGPGRNALTATGLDVVPSLFNLLHALADSGYTTGELPRTPDELFGMIQNQGIIPRGYARGVAREFLEQGRPARVTADTLTQWMRRSLPKPLVEAAAAKYGRPPGTYLSGEDSSGTAIVAVPRIRFGNVAILPQLLPGEGDSSEAAIRGGAHAPPPYPYIASYLWIREGFKADVLMHFGTYGSFEFLPYKQAPLSSNDWPDALLGPLPHVYLYCVESVGDALIAKRRGYATIVSHLTPPFRRAGAYGRLRGLKALIDEHSTISSAALELPYRRHISALVCSLGLQRDLALPLDPDAPIADSALERIARHVREIAGERIHEGLYVLDSCYTPEQVVSTCKEMMVDMLAYRLAELERHNSAATEARGRKAAREHDRYRTTAYGILDAVLRDQREASDYISPRQRARLTALREPADPTVEQTAERDALEAYVRALERIEPLRRQLAVSPRREMASLCNALGGGYVAPSSGGDPIRNPDVVPTGRNLVGINPEQTPDEAAWRLGEQIAQQLMERHLRRNGEYPRKVVLTLWGGEYIRDRGATVAQALHLLGVKPVRNRGGIVHDVALIPCEKLKRPRVDVVIQTSGQFRDLAASRLELLDKAVRLAAESDERDCANHVRAGTLEMEQRLTARGYSPRKARELATTRLFGGIHGRYGAGIRELVQAGDRWGEKAFIARQYLSNMGAMYTKEGWGSYEEGLFAAALEGTDIVAQSVNSHITGPLALDNVYEFMGGVSAAVELVSGTAPSMVFNDIRDRFDPQVRDAREMIWAEARAGVLNPDYVSGMLGGGASSLESIAETFRNCFGWNALDSRIVDHHLWEELHATYIEDMHGLGVADTFGRKNPYALQEMTAVMLESARKGLWKASPNTVRDLARRHARLVSDKQAGCSMHVCGNGALQRFVAEQLGRDLARSYTEQIGAALRAGDSPASKSLRLEKVGQRSVGRLLEQHGTVAVVGVVVLVFVLIVGAGMIRSRRE